MKPLWFGAISFGLVNIPIRLYSPAPEEKIDFDLLHAKDRSPVRYARFCKKEEREIPWQEIVHGFKKNGRYLVFSDDDFKRANPKKSKEIEIKQFVKLTDIDAMYFEKPYYVEPAEGAVKAYAILREALQRSGTVGIATFVMHNREYLAVVKPHGNMLVVMQMRFDEDLVPATGLNVPKNAAVDRKDLSLALKFIEQATGTFRPREFHDEYVDELKALISRKAHGHERPAAKHPPKRVRKVHSRNLTSLLKRSLAKHRAE